MVVDESCDNEVKQSKNEINHVSNERPIILSVESILFTIILLQEKLF